MIIYLLGDERLDLSIREANREDARDLSELFAELVGKETNLDKLKTQLDFLSTQPNYYVAVACLDNQVIGSAMGLVCPDIVGDCRPYLLVKNVVVSILHQGKGIGKKLMNTLEEYAHQH